MNGRRSEERADKKSTVIVTTLGSFLIPFMGSSVNIALPTLGREFGMNAVLLGWVTTTYLLAVAMFLIPFGRIADIYGRKRIFLQGVAVYTLASFFLATAPSPLWLILFRFLQGTGAAMAFTTMVAILTSVFAPGERGKVLGINVTAVYGGLSCGPFFGGLLTEHWGWRSIFVIQVPLGVFIVGLTLLKLKGEWIEAKGERFDVAGALLYSLTLVALMYGLSGITGVWGIACLLVGAFGLFLFVKRETKASAPLLDVKLFWQNRVFALSNLAALVNYSATFAVTFLLSLYLQIVQGMSPQQAGLILVFQPIVQAALSPFTGWLSDRMDPGILASAGMGLTALGLVLLTFLNPGTKISTVVVGLILLGVGFGLFSSPNTNAVMSSVEKRSYGVASGTLGTMRAVGMMFSMGVTLLIFALNMGRVPLSPALALPFMRSMRMAFLVFTVLCVCGIFASLSRGKTR